MLRITVELIPHGNELLKKTLGEMSIRNDGTGTELKGNYVCRMVDFENDIFEEKLIRAFERDSGFWSLLKRSLE